MVSVQKLCHYSQTQQNRRKKSTKRLKLKQNKIHSRTLWWKSYIPHNAIDPISLEPLHELTYPPFALTISQPYHIIYWPLPIIIKTPFSSIHLFDGCSLANYLLSQYQFIDPLNRRQLVREEVCHLNTYLQRHSPYTMNVIEAFDGNKKKIPKASVFAQSEEGRMQIHQQEERDVLESIFSRNRTELLHQQQHIENTLSHVSYIQSGGIVIMDDSLNSGMRGGERSTPNTNNSFMNEFPTIRNQEESLISQQQQTWYRQSEMNYQHIFRQNQQDRFPSLQSVVELNTKKTVAENNISKLSYTLKKIDKSQKIIPKIKKSRIGCVHSPSLSVIYNTKKSLNIIKQPISLQLERNQPFEPFIIQPASARSYSLRWKCPTIIRTTPNTSDYLTGLMQYTSYPEILFLQAKSQFQTLCDIEQKWITFVRNKKEQSIQLNKLTKSMRALVHEYSLFWNILTTSYNALPFKQKKTLYHRTHQYQYQDTLQMGCTKYIHCGKTKGTEAPKLLLSEAVKVWRGKNSVLKKQITIPLQPNVKSVNGEIVPPLSGFERKNSSESKNDTIRVKTIYQ